MINLDNQNKAIYKTRNTGTEKGMRETRGMFSTIPGNLLEDSVSVIILTFREC